jgi:hypothetical protein
MGRQRARLDVRPWRPSSRRFATFDDWLRYVFAHRVQEPEWWWRNPRRPWDASVRPVESVRLLTRLFEKPEVLIGAYSPEQIGQGFWFLCCDFPDRPVTLLNDARLPLAVRLQGIGAVGALYERLFARTCSAAYVDSHTEEPDILCFMLWDIGFRHWPHKPKRHPALLKASLRVMRDALALENRTCQMSALHGLGHFQHEAPREVRRIIDGFLAKGGHPPRMVEYARCARRGRVQ